MFFAVFNDSHVVLPGNPFCSFQDFICAYSKLNTILSAWAFSLIFSWSCAPMLLDYNFFKIWNICHSFLLMSRQRKWRNSIPRISLVHFWSINSQQMPTLTARDTNVSLISLCILGYRRILECFDPENLDSSKQLI